MEKAAKYPRRDMVWSRAQGGKKEKEKKKGIYSHNGEVRESVRRSSWRLFCTPPIPRAPPLPDLIQIFSPGVAGADETLDPGRLRRTRAVCWLWKRAEDNNNLLSLPLRRRRSQLYFFVKLCYWLENTSMKS